MLPINSIAKEAWKLISGIKLQAFIYLLIIAFIPYALSIFIFSTVPYFNNFLIAGFIVSLIAIAGEILKAYVGLRIIMLGIKQTSSLTTIKENDNMDVFYLLALYALFRIVLKYIFLINLNVVLAYALSFIFSLLALPLFIFSMPFVIYNHLNFKNALLRGYQMLGIYWKEITFYILVPACFVNILINSYDFYFIQEKLAMQFALSHFGALVTLVLVLLPILLIILFVALFANIAGILYRNAAKNIA